MHSISGGAHSRYQSGPQRERPGFKHLGHLKKLIPFISRYRWWFLLAVVGLLVNRFALAYIPQFMRTAITSLEDAAKEPQILWPALGILGAVAIQFVVYYPARRTLRRIAISVTYELRKRIFNNSQYQGPDFFAKFGTGDLMARAINDVSQVRMFVSFGLVSILMMLFTVSVSMYFMISMSVTLAIAATVPLPFVLLCGFVMSRKMYPYFMQRQESMAMVTSFTQENLNGIRTIQSMAQEDREIEKFRDVCTDYSDKAYSASRFMAVMNLTMTTITAVSPVVILFYGGYLVMTDTLTIGDFQAFLAYLLMVTGSLSFFGWSLALFTSAAAGTERIFEVIDAEPEVQESVNVYTGETTASLQIKGLTHIYAESKTPAIQDVNMVVKEGATVALLGRTASGKSTVMKSLVRLINTPTNTVFLGGHDICSIPIQRLRSEIALVPQESFLFSITLGNNVTYDDPSRQSNEVLNSVRVAGLGQTIDGFSEGLETMVGERGITLSGGQQQRTTLARGVIRNSKILLLDDVFSSVDTETEERIIGELRALRKNKTTILISHRVSTARHADYIYIFEEGKVIEEGTHIDLINAGGYYSDLESVQSNQDVDKSRRERLMRTLQKRLEEPDQIEDSGVLDTAQKTRAVGS